MNNWIPIDEFYKLNYSGYVWITNGRIVSLVSYQSYDGEFTLSNGFRIQNNSIIRSVIPIPEPKP